MTIKWGLGALVAVAGILVAADGVMAQAPGGRGGGFGGRMGGRGGIVSLAGNAAVQKDLGLDDATKSKVTAITEEYTAEARDQLQGLGNLQDASAEERAQMMAKMMENAQKLAAKYSPKLKETLSAEQFTRLQQINWQAQGATALTDAELAKSLELSPDQIAKISEVIQDYSQKQRGLFGGGGGGDFQEIAAKMRELTKERDTKAAEVLSKDQAEKFTKLKGKEFDLTQLQPAGGRPGGGRPNNDKN